MMPNREFLDVMRANFASDAKLMIGCQAGARSAQASEMLVLAGFNDVLNVTGGFGGARDPMTGAVQCRGLDPGRAASRNRDDRGARLRRPARHAGGAGSRRRVIARAFHGWERRLASASTDRVVRPFEWGVEWIDPARPTCRDPAAWLEHWADAHGGRQRAFYRRRRRATTTRSTGDG